MWVCVRVGWRLFYCLSSWAAKPDSDSVTRIGLGWAAPPSLIVKCMQTVGEYCCHRCCCCCCCRDWCCSGCRYFCASDGNTFINFTAGHWQRQQAPPVASCQLPVALSLRSSIFSPVLRADCLFLFLFPTALLLLLLQI